eukprot:scaffold7799_cov94-Skeletonema_dohrnii-CCMP3373.AAC.11
MTAADRKLRGSDACTMDKTCKLSLLLLYRLRVLSSLKIEPTDGNFAPKVEIAKIQHDLNLNE